MKYSLFLIEERNDFTNIEIHPGYYWFDTLKQAREALMYQLDILSKSSKSNIYQPTMNFKDRFHYWTDEGYKRHLVISKYYKSNRYSIFMKRAALEKINDISKPI